MDIAAALVNKNPLLRKRLKMAKVNQSPKEFITSSLKNAAMMSISIIVLLFFYFDKNDKPLIYLLPALIIFFFLFYQFNFAKLTAKIIKRRKEIDKDVLFAGRYLLVKLNSGQPLMNALVDASNSYGIASNYFKEIVRDIELGKPIEQALTDAAEYSPSDKFRKIVFQISNALKIGIDVTEFLDATLNEIADQQLIEINKYGKKLNSVTMFYMLFAVVLPSLGLTIFIVVASLAGINVDVAFFAVLLVFIAILQMMFLIVYKSIRPNINI
ncbi:MAG: type II secretion system F family protein [Candidatus Woesearchaeota archaeon]|jgi:flagellar protein FlaJ